MLRLTVFLAALAIGLSACSDSTTNPPAEYVADNNSFKDYSTWTQTTAPRTGPDPAGKLFGAHDENEAGTMRYMWINAGDAKANNDGQFANGTRVVKEVRNADGTVRMTLAMAKRGGSFNSANKGWEWFIIGTDGSITQRDAALMSGMCNGCHSAASGDYVFTRQ